jgi:hypothetical protein
MADITQDDVNAAALEPLKTEGEEGAVTSRPLSELQAAADRAAGIAAVAQAGSAWAAIGKARVVPPGTIGPSER